MPPEPRQRCEIRRLEDELDGFIRQRNISDSIPWWQPDSGADHFTRSAFEPFYADADHPLAAPPPEWRHDEVASPRREKHHSRRHREPPHR